ncbi:MAG: hypothetical protein JW967_01605 [Dehalococcoidales bacterium]|nr:hypothetical protein [Dehalococcoidales bacterium]
MAKASVAVKHEHKFNHRGVDNIYRCSCGLTLKEYCEQNVYGHKRKESGAGRPKKKLKDILRKKLEEIAMVNEQPNYETKNIGLLPVPPRPVSRHSSALKKYYLGNLAQILSEYEVLGDKGIKERWGMSDTYWIRLKLENNIPINHKVKPHTPAVVKDEKPAAAGEKKTVDISKAVGVIIINPYMPEYPEFSLCKDGSVQMEWISGYIELVKLSWSTAKMEAS